MIFLRFIRLENLKDFINGIMRELVLNIWIIAKLAGLAAREFRHRVR